MCNIKEIKCPENIAGVGKSHYPEGIIKYETQHFLIEGFTKVTTKNFKDSLKSL